MSVLRAEHQKALRDLLFYLGEDPEREGLRETPKRVLNAWEEWLCGYKQDPAQILKSFENDSKYDEMIVLDSIPIQSMCEHHMVPFVGVAAVGYLPNERILGLSKIPRLVNIFARRLQVQERLTCQIADTLMEHLKPKGVGVVIRAEHFCMATRGVHTPGVFTTTSAMRGIFLEEHSVRTEFLSLAGTGRAR